MEDETLVRIALIGSIVLVGGYTIDHLKNRSAREICFYKGMEMNVNKYHPEWKNSDSPINIQRRTTYFSGKVVDNPIAGSAQESEAFERIAEDGRTARESVEKYCKENPYLYW